MPEPFRVFPRILVNSYLEQNDVRDNVKENFVASSLELLMQMALDISAIKNIRSFKYAHHCGDLGQRQICHSTILNLLVENTMQSPF